MEKIKEKIKIMKTKVLEINKNSSYPREIINFITDKHNSDRWEGYIYIDEFLTLEVYLDYKYVGGLEIDNLPYFNKGKIIPVNKNITIEIVKDNYKEQK